jgi:hypothetical protein
MVATGWNQSQSNNSWSTTSQLQLQLQLVTLFKQENWLQLWLQPKEAATTTQPDLQRLQL